MQGHLSACSTGTPLSGKHFSFCELAYSDKQMIVVVAVFAVIVCATVADKTLYLDASNGNDS